MEGYEGEAYQRVSDQHHWGCEKDRIVWREELTAEQVQDRPSSTPFNLELGLPSIVPH